MSGFGDNIHVQSFGTTVYRYIVVVTNSAVIIVELSSSSNNKAGKICRNSENKKTFLQH